jgi:hypothetical protein
LLPCYHRRHYVLHLIGYGGEAELRDMAKKAGLAEATAKEK